MSDMRNAEIKHIAQLLAANDIGTDLEWVADEWEELNQQPYMSEARKLVIVVDALSSYRAASEGRAA